MFKHAIACLFGAVLLLLLVAIPLDRYLQLDSQGRRMTMKELPAASPRHDLYREGWWKSEASILQVRRIYRQQTDEEFLEAVPVGSEAYDAVAAVLEKHRVPQRCPLRPTHGGPEQATFQAAR